MEHIGKTLGRLSHQPSTQTPIPSDTSNECQDGLSIARRLNVSSISHTFDNFKRVKGTEEMLDVMKLIAEGTDRKFVFLYGTVGCGKTYIIESLIIQWANKGIFTRYNTNSQLMRMFKNCMKPQSIPSYEEMFRRICQVDRLIIDDMGMGTAESTWELATLEDIINERYHMRYFPTPVITIMATNKDITEIPDRITSRFYDPEVGLVLCNRAQDYRKRKV